MPTKKTTSKPTFDERYKALNKAQKEAVDTIDGPVMVIAGPGSGKTELLSLRVGNILKQGTAKASNILCLTFTETAARNMRERLESLIGPDAYRVAIYTFHSFCTDIIGRYPEYFFDATSYRSASELIQSEILEKIFEKLPHRHILGGHHKERGYAYLNEVKSRIKDIKKGGLTPARFRELLDENSQAFVELHTILRKHLPERIGKDSIHAFEDMKKLLEKTESTLGKMYAHSIGEALKEAQALEKNTPLSTWKSSYTGKDDDDNRVFKDFLNLPKLYALSDIYEEYQEKLHKGGYFDFEDMILEVVEALKKSVSLRTELEEMYQYILVDEFQDTNNAQLSLVKALSSNEVHEGRPNVCVVGDDDQAIYKFQGAEISNIHSFKELYRDVTTIVLIENYRSTQKILDFARTIVTQGVHRLETKYKEIRKDLVAKNKNLPVGEIHTYTFTSEEKEYAYIAGEVKKLLSKKVEAKEIALITRKHSQLTALLPYLDAVHIPYTYTRKENVFDEKHVQELIMLCRLLSSIGDATTTREDLLPTILTFSFWGLNRISIWKVAEHAKRESISWLTAMEQSSDTHIQTIAHFLIELGIEAQSSPLEVILDTLIGSRESTYRSEGEEDDEVEPFTPLKLATTFVSPYKEYYFGKNILKKDISSYVSFQSSLKVFVHALREYKEGEALRVHDVGDFVDMHTEYGIPLINETQFAHNENSVSLLTTHSAKGLEFDYVFTVSVNDSIWAGRPRSNKIVFPVNLPLASAGDSEDDFIRLFYVALTRARHTLYITHHDAPLRFLPQGKSVEMVGDNDTSSGLVSEGLHIYHAPPFAKDEKALLQKLVEGYTLSPTHLNNFLDITKGGPLLFLEQNLLRFPQAKSPSSVYGSAIHKALEEAHIYAKKNKTAPPLEGVIQTFVKELRRGRLRSVEEEKFRNRGEKVLSEYYDLKKRDMNGKHIVELNFKKQSVEIDGALLTGKIDMILEDGTDWKVVDLKTGKGFSDWDEPKQSVYDEIKLHHYRHQLMMYKLLVEHSRDFSQHTVIEGILQFVEEIRNGTVEEISITFGDKNSKGELERTKALAISVYKKIMNLDFPDTSHYEENLDGIKQFEEDLISGKI